MKHECMCFERIISACAKKMFLLFAVDFSAQWDDAAALAADEA